ncbi:SulP family inorganic anion transporter [Aquincola sp. MAHUQ-54]|uniref:SulP family inorganic anion transporter n=1 Tax=Aquincola agrisoli TaxID=3119538 RepID=A0AAW9Q7E1_9BURK
MPLPSFSAVSPSRLAARLFGDWVHEVSRGTLKADALAGLLGAVLVLPQAIAFATLAGLPPQFGLYTAVLPCAVAALAGSSRHVMSGPTNANSLALYAMLAPLAAVGTPQYVQLALVVTLMVGVMQAAIGLFRLGAVANFISPAALQGFTAGAALLIAVHASHDMLGIALPAGQSAGTVLVEVVRRIELMNPAALLVGAAALGCALAVRRWRRQWPFMLLGLAVGTLVGWWVSLGSLWPPVRTVGRVDSPWPPLTVPAVSWQQVPELASLAFALTIVALGQSFSIAKAVAARSGQRIDANREFIGQGLSNVVGSFSSSYVSCGSLNRSMPNLEAGARTPLAAVFSAGLLVLLVAFSAPVLALIPMAAIAALLLLVAWGLFDLPRWRTLWRVSRGEFAIAAATLAATVTLRLEVAILFGTMLSLVSYLHRTSRPAMRTMGFDSRIAHDRPFVVIDGHPPGALPECPQLKLLRMEGSIYFGATAHVADRLHELRKGGEGGVQKHLLVMSKSMNFIDLAGAELWEAEMSARRAMGGDLYFHRPRPAVLDAWARIGFIDRLGEDHLYRDKRSALADIVPRLDPGICARCEARIFFDCPPRPGTSVGEGI